MNEEPFEPDAALVPLLVLATPQPGDFVLYCPVCEFIGPTNAAMRPYDHDRACGRGLRIWRNGRSPWSQPGELVR